MEAVQCGVAQLAHAILGEPEENLERFPEFLEFGVTKSEKSDQAVIDTRAQTLALLSATAVLIDILPSLILNDNQDSETTKLSKDQRQKRKRSSQVLEYYDALVTKMTKAKLARGPSIILNSGICSSQYMDQKRLQHLVSVVISFACSANGKEARAALKNRIKEDLHSNNFDLTRLIVQSVCREKISDRLNCLVPLLNNLRFALPSRPAAPKQQQGQKIDKQLARDLALGSTEFTDHKKLKQQEAGILSDLIALFVRVIRASQTGQYSFDSIRTCIEGISQHITSVNSDLAIELERELFDLSRFMLVTKRSDGSSKDESNGLLGAIALSALLNISKGSKERQAVLTDSIISATETLVPIALNKLATSTEGGEETLTQLCKGAIAVASQWGSDRCMLSIAKALLNALCLRFDDRSKLIVDLLVHVAGRSTLVRSAIDPDGVLVDGNDETGSVLEKSEVSLFYQLQFLMGSRFAADPTLGNYLVGNLSKYCKLLARRDAQDALNANKLIDDEQYLARKKKKLAM